jgi:hypothetical protein
LVGWRHIAFARDHAGEELLRLAELMGTTRPPVRLVSRLEWLIRMAGKMNKKLVAAVQRAVLRYGRGVFERLDTCFADVDSAAEGQLVADLLPCTATGSLVLMLGVVTRAVPLEIDWWDDGTANNRDKPSEQDFRWVAGTCLHAAARLGQPPTHAGGTAAAPVLGRWCL